MKNRLVKRNQNSALKYLFQQNKAFSPPLKFSTSPMNIFLLNIVPQKRENKNDKKTSINN